MIVQLLANVLITIMLLVIIVYAAWYLTLAFLAFPIMLASLIFGVLRDLRRR